MYHGQLLSQDLGASHAQQETRAERESRLKWVRYAMEIERRFEKYGHRLSAKGLKELRPGG